MADPWLVVWSSFSPSIPASKRKLRPTSVEHRRDFGDQRTAVYFVMEKLKPLEQRTARLHGAGASFDLEQIKAMFATYKDN